MYTNDSRLKYFKISCIHCTCTSCHVLTCLTQCVMNINTSYHMLTCMAQHIIKLYILYFVSHINLCGSMCQLRFKLYISCHMLAYMFLMCNNFILYISSHVLHGCNLCGSMCN